MKILMVCLGNICRSPLAEGILQQKIADAGLDWVVDSAGTNGYHVGEAPHPLSQKVARLHHIDISSLKARKFVPEDFGRYDKIYAMAEDVVEDMKSIAKFKFDKDKVDLIMNEVFPGRNMDVPDPWAGPESGYHQVFLMLDKAADEMIKKYAVTAGKGINTPE